MFCLSSPAADLPRLLLLVSTNTRQSYYLANETVSDNSNVWKLMAVLSAYKKAVKVCVRACMHVCVNVCVCVGPGAVLHSKLPAAQRPFGICTRGRRCP